MELLHWGTCGERSVWESDGKPAQTASLPQPPPNSGNLWGTNDKLPVHSLKTLADCYNFSTTFRSPGLSLLWAVVLILAPFHFALTMLLPGVGGTGNTFLDPRPGIKPSPSISFGENFLMMIIGAGISRNFLEDVAPELGLGRERERIWIRKQGVISPYQWGLCSNDRQRRPNSGKSWEVLKDRERW